MGDCLNPRFLFLLLAFPAWLPAQAADPDDEPRRLPLLMTESGLNYEDVHILQLDPEGPIFRHRRGIAKIPYTEIKAKTRKLLGYPQPAPKPVPGKNAPKAASPAQPEATAFVPVRITTLWVAFAPRDSRFGPATCLPHPFHHGRHGHPFRPFEDPFRPFAAIDLMVNAGIVPPFPHAAPCWSW